MCAVSSGHYALFLNIVENSFNGFENKQRGKAPVWIEPFCLAAYDLLSIKKPETERERFFSQLSPEFTKSAKSELYRARGGWIARGRQEGKIISFRESDKIYLVPKKSIQPSVGIDSSLNLFIICFFDNHLGGISYLENSLQIPKSTVGKSREFKWQKLNRVNREKITQNIVRLLNISSKAILVISSNFINSDNPLTHGQMAGLIDGCFAGYNKHPTQNSMFRQKLREKMFSYCDGIPTHCDPDFQKLSPSEIVRIIIRGLSIRDGKTRECTPSYATLDSHESLPIQLADLVAGCLSRQILDEIKPPIPCDHLFFRHRRISRKDRREGRWAKAYYWMRSD